MAEMPTAAMPDARDKEDKDDVLSAGKKAFALAQDAESDNRLVALDDIRFARLGEQWPSEIEAERKRTFRPCLTINKMKAFIRQVVNDSRQNKPSIKVHPADSGADVQTADIINGLIRNIEYTSNADVAYDTAVEASVSGGFGYWRIGMDYACDDSFDMDLSIDRVSNQFSIYGDPNSTSADSSDWDQAFVVDRIPKAEFKRKYKGKTNVDDEPCAVDFDSDAWSATSDWLNEDGVMIAEWWQRTEVETEIVKLSNGHVYKAEDLLAEPDLQMLIEAGVLKEVSRRPGKTYKVTQTIMTGADVLEVNDWPGRYIPIVPVYGDEIIVEGKRYFRSLIHDAKDAQRMVNYWRTTATELVALAPRVPYIGKKGSFDSDASNWATANTQSHAYLEYEGQVPPQRQPLDSGVAAGSLQEALNASDDMKAIIGMYDASLGARSNETSGVAIQARQREGDVSTFHFIDNLTRAIRHTGRILIDLIPHVYTEERIVRVIGEDGSQTTAKVNAQQPGPQMGQDGQPIVDKQGQAIMGVYDLTAGKYDLTVTSGPSYTTRRQETADQMMGLLQAFPQAAPYLGGFYAKNLDWPGADEIADMLDKINPANQQQGVPPELQAQMAKMQQAITALEQQNQSLKAGHDINQFKAETDRMKVEAETTNQSTNTAITALSHLSKAQQPIN